MLKQEVDQLKFKGFQNLGNTCYMNSFLQMIYNVTDVRHAIIGLDLKKMSEAKSEKKGSKSLIM